MLDLTGLTMNTMALAGFAVAVGVVVDDAIIDMENIVRRLRGWRAEGRPVTPLQLVLAASLEVRVAIFYATLINIVAVLPVMLVGGLTGAFFEPLALAYGLAVLASMLVALTVTPALGLILLGNARLAPRRSAADAGAQGRLHPGAAAGVAHALVGVRDRRGLRSPRRSPSTRGSARDLFPTSKSPTSWCTSSPSRTPRWRTWIAR